MSALSELDSEPLRGLLVEDAVEMGLWRLSKPRGVLCCVEDWENRVGVSVEENRSLLTSVGGPPMADT